MIGGGEMPYADIEKIGGKYGKFATRE